MRSSSPDSALVTVSLPRRRLSSPLLDGRRLGRRLGALLADGLFFLFGDAAAAARRFGRRLGAGGGLRPSFPAGARLPLRRALRLLVGGLARIFLGLAFLGGGAFVLEAFFFDGAVAGLFLARLRASSSETRASARAAPRRAFSSSVSWRSTTPARWRARRAAARRGFGGRGRLRRRFLGMGLGGRCRADAGALLLDHHRLGAAMAEALLDGGGLRLLQRQRLGRGTAGAAR